MFCRSLFVLLNFFSFGHCVVCSSSIYGFWLPPFGIFKLVLKTHLPMPVLHLHNNERVVVAKWAIIQLYRAKNTHCILPFLTLGCIAMDVKGDYLFFITLDQNGHVRYFYHWASVVVHRLYTLTFQSSLKPQDQLESNLLGMYIGWSSKIENTQKKQEAQMCQNDCFLYSFLKPLGHLEPNFVRMFIGWSSKDLIVFCWQDIYIKTRVKKGVVRFSTFSLKRMAHFGVKQRIAHSLTHSLTLPAITCTYSLHFSDWVSFTFMSILDLIQQWPTFYTTICPT